MNISSTEENYLKAIYKLTKKTNENEFVTTNNIANDMHTKAASVTDMLKRLSEKKLVTYQRYKGVKLTAKGQSIATQLIRKHRLWEVFLLEKLQFKWDEIHVIAEQLEHIESDELTNRLEAYLDYPKYDPHGDPIPDINGYITNRNYVHLADLQENEEGVIVGVKEHSPEFLRYLESHQLILGAVIKVLKCNEYDKSVEIEINKKLNISISNKVSYNLYVQKK